METRRGWDSKLREEDWLAWAGRRDLSVLRLADQGRAGALAGEGGSWAGQEQQEGQVFPPHFSFPGVAGWQTFPPGSRLHGERPYLSTPLCTPRAHVLPDM